MTFVAPRKLDGRWYFCSGSAATRYYRIGSCWESCDGHDYPDEAAEHFKRWAVAERLTLNVRKIGKWRACAVCRPRWAALRERWVDAVPSRYRDRVGRLLGLTDRLALVAGRWFWTLCSEHQQRKTVIELMKSVDISDGFNW